MIKILSVLTAFLAASAAQATLSVGATARFQGTVYDATGAVLTPFDLSLELLGVDAAAGTVRMRTTWAMPGTPDSVQESSDKATIAPDAAALNSYIAQCASPQVGGVPETLVVAAGVFPTCKIPVDDQDSKGFVWIGAVPFSSVKSDVIQKSTGQHWVTELSSFQF